jgi:superfamily I DNA and/or RNA helicase
MNDVEQLEQYITGNILANAQVVAATPVGANHYTVRQMRYGTVFIDEAGQALEPACWIPILKGKKLVLAGDHQQLPPTLKSEAAAKGGLGVTLLERCVALYPQAVVMLREQYRMHQQIMGYSSQVFYQDMLTAHYTVAGHQLYEGDAPLQFIDTAGCGYDEKNEEGAISNPEEAAFLLRHLEKLAEELYTRLQPGLFPSVGIIAPYRQQVNVLKELLEHSTVLRPLLAHITVNTVDSFQGQERDIIYISLTRCNSDGVIGFLGDTRRMNVAMTRARKKLVVTGDSATLGRHKFYAGFMAYAEAHNAWFSAWEFMD